MKKKWNLLAILPLVGLLSSCDLAEQVEYKARKINHYENVALTLAKQNRELKAQINRLEFEVESLKSKNNFLQIQLEEKKAKDPVAVNRTIASVKPVAIENDLVKFDVYKWTPSQMLAMADKEFQKQNFEKSAQFFHSFALNFPENKNIDDQFLFQAGVAAFESGSHHDWTLYHLGKLIEDYPASEFYRGAKLWVALTHLKMGEQDKFFETVEEFRKKYRNTSEWKILSHHYEKIVQKYKTN